MSLRDVWGLSRAPVNLAMPLDVAGFHAAVRTGQLKARENKLTRSPFAVMVNGLQINGDRVPDALQLEAPVYVRAIDLGSPALRALVERFQRELELTGSAHADALLTRNPHTFALPAHTIVVQRTGAEYAPPHTTHTLQGLAVVLVFKPLTRLDLAWHAFMQGSDRTSVPAGDPEAFFVERLRLLRG